jgi:ABC-type sugar transport system ATPase subunit
MNMDITSQRPLLEMNGITKRFPGVLALHNVDLQLRKGEVLGLLGENGAGKSTLLKILSGAYHADRGEIFIEGAKRHFKTPLDAAVAGVSIIYQELYYYNDLTVAENIFVGRLPRNRLGMVQWPRLYAQAREVLDGLGVQIDPKVPQRQLTTAEKQLVEISKAISRNMKILVMDEPTAALNDAEVTKLFVIIKKLAKSGIGVVYISHRIEELFDLADRVQVLRDGEKIGVFEIATTSKGELVQAMVGREIADMYPKRGVPIGGVALEVNDLGNDFLRRISFFVKEGEILGVFGLMGSGRTNLCETLFGVQKAHSGTITIGGKKVAIRSPQEAKKVGLAYVPSERKTEGLILIQTVRENLSTAIIRRLQRIFFIQQKKERDNALRWVKELSVATPGIEGIVESLSGGNQQKVVIGKWLETRPRVIVLNEPTRGVDVGAKVEIYAIIERLCEQGMAVVLISSEQPEILALADRIMVMCEGRVTGCLAREHFSPAALMHLAIGGN